MTLFGKLYVAIIISSITVGGIFSFIHIFFPKLTHYQEVWSYITADGRPGLHFYPEKEWVMLVIFLSGIIFFGVGTLGCLLPKKWIRT